VLQEAMADWFETNQDLPWMSMAVRLRAGRGAQVPAVVHADGTCRPQSVSAAEAPRFHDLIARFAQLTGVPMLLNTSLNRQAPIVCTAAEALDLFLVTGLDRLCVGGAMLVRKRAG
jgi:carbamoyltransferase